VVSVQANPLRLQPGEPWTVYRDSLAPGESSEPIPFPTDSLYGISWSWYESFRDPNLAEPQRKFLGNQIFRAYHSWDASSVDLAFKGPEYVETPPIEFR
jgi:hypothetical protein